MSDSVYTCDWRSNPNYPDIVISDTGRVMSYKRGKWTELKPNNNGCGYYRVGIGHENPCYIHRLVAETYVSNPDPKTKTQINHINGNKADNRACNLEWCTPSENAKHAFATGLKHSAGKRIRIKETGEVFESEAECARHINGIQGNIASCLSNKRHTHRGYHFEYMEDESYG